ncbi:MAG TPA: hypothetical protein VGP73_20290 [Thermoanaerobaculia bacterium]
MPAGRIALLAGGLLLALGALFLIFRGFGGGAAAPADAAPETSAAAPAAGGKGEKEPPPKWQSFMRPDERQAPSRPVVHLAGEVPNPFDRLPAAPAVAAAKTENPGLRLEGISAAGGRPVALVSGHAVREGGTVSGLRVARIGGGTVTLAAPDGGRLELALGAPAPPPIAAPAGPRAPAPARSRIAGDAKPHSPPPPPAALQPADRARPARGGGR